MVSAFDRTHIFNASMSYDLGHGYRVGTHLMFYTGYPNTSLVPGSTTDVQQTGRLPPFFRFDWRAEKRWKIKRGWLSLVLEEQNAMLARDSLQQLCAPLGVSCPSVPVTIPSIGLEGGI
jgi:hypothetical protein